jgi:hypothetical protein
MGMEKPAAGVARAGTYLGVATGGGGELLAAVLRERFTNAIGSARYGLRRRATVATDGGEHLCGDPERGAG